MALSAKKFPYKSPQYTKRCRITTFRALLFPRTDQHFLTAKYLLQLEEQKLTWKLHKNKSCVLFKIAIQVLKTCMNYLWQYLTFNFLNFSWPICLILFIYFENFVLEWGYEGATKKDKWKHTSQGYKKNVYLLKMYTRRCVRRCGDLPCLSL